MAAQYCPEPLIGEQPARRNRDQPALIPARIDSDHTDQMAVRYHPRAGHPRPRRPTLPGGWRRGGHIQVKPAFFQLPERGQVPVHVRGVPPPVRLG